MTILKRLRASGGDGTADTAPPARPVAGPEPAYASQMPPHTGAYAAAAMADHSFLDTSYAGGGGGMLNTSHAALAQSYSGGAAMAAMGSDQPYGGESLLPAALAPMATTNQTQVQLSELETEKRAAVEAEDYDRAKLLKAQIDSFRSGIFYSATQGPGSPARMHSDAVPSPRRRLKGPRECPEHPGEKLTLFDTRCSSLYLSLHCTLPSLYPLSTHSLYTLRHVCPQLTLQVRPL